MSDQYLLMSIHDNRINILSKPNTKQEIFNVVRNLISSYYRPTNYYIRDIVNNKLIRLNVSDLGNLLEVYCEEDISRTSQNGACEA